MFKRAIAMMLSVLTVNLAVSGCSGSASTQETGKTRDDLVVIIPADFTTLDPQKLPSTAEINFCANIFDTLVVVDENGEIQPSLAESWTPSEDGLSYTFKLKEGVQFHNGEELKASDVVYTVNRFIEEEWMLFCSFMIEGAEALDDYNVKINLKYPYGSFLSNLEYMYIVNQKTMEEMGDEASKNPIGTGPYKFVKWDVAQQIVLEANEDYFGKKASIKNLTFKIIPDANTAFVALETGEADLSFNVSPIDFEQAQNNEKFGTDSCAGNSCYFVNFNSEKLDKTVRQALCYAINKETVNTMVNEGTGIVTNLPLLEGQEGYTTDLETYDYDVEKAKELLAQAGVEPGTLNIDFFYGEGTENDKLGQTLQSMFNEVGVNLTLNPVETGTWWQLFGEGDYYVSRGGYPMEAANTDMPYYDMYHKDGTFNVSRINNPEINELLEQGRTELDAEKRNEIYVKVSQIIAEEAYCLPLYFNRSTIVYNKDLKNVKAVNNQRYLYSNFSWE